ncbi:MAG TPA: hypothetical protein DDW52_28960 [Planctomycetaceae bacterium]|nr:hypothetical protein [Planctomycetaceae bacterium]
MILLSIKRLAVVSAVLFFSGQIQAAGPLRVYVLVGQSNMQGHAHIRTLAHLGMSEETRGTLEKIQSDDGQPRVFDDVCISYLSRDGVKTGPLSVGYGANEEKIGPELMFGIRMHELSGEPILLIKAAWGGKSLNTDFRPPSAGEYVFAPEAIARLEKQGKDVAQIKEQRREATGVYYRQTIDHVKKTLASIEEIHPAYSADAGYELAGLVWFQGWNDMVDSGTYPLRGQPGGYAAYSEVLKHLIADFRRDLGSPELPFVVGVLGVGGPTELYGPSQQRYLSTHQGFRDAMAAPASDPDLDKVAAVLTEKCWDRKLDELVELSGRVRGEARKLARAEDLQSAVNVLFKEEGNADQALTRVAELQASKQLQKALTDAMLAKELSESERKLLEIGVSNGGYHYLGSSKIMTCIGKSFADAMWKLRQ